MLSFTTVMADAARDLLMATPVFWDKLVITPSIFHVLKTSTCTCYILYLYCSLYMIFFKFVCIVLSNEKNIMWINCILWFLLIILLVDIVGVLIDNLKHLFVCLIMRLLKKLHKKLGYGTGSEEIFLHYNNKQDGNKT